MTDTKISQLSAMLKGMQSMTSAMEAEASKKTEAAFGALLNQTANSSCEKQYSWTQQVGNASVSKESNQVVYEKETAKSSFKDNHIVKKNDGIASKLPEDAKEQLEAIESEVKEVLEEKLDVSEDELLTAMEQLQLTVFDLTNPSNLAQLVMQLTGSQDGSELLLNSDFQALMTQVEELFGQLAQDLNLTPEEFQQLAKMQQDMSAQTEEGISLNLEKQTEEVQKEDNASVAGTEKAETTAGIKADEIIVSDKARPVEEAVMEEADEQTVTHTELRNEEQMDEEAGNTGEQKSLLSESSAVLENAKSDSQQNHVSFQTTVQTVNNGQAAEVTQTVVQTPIDVENILRQMNQMTRISVTQAQSSIEMQLNPENLGKVYLQVVSKEGAITAQIAAQNEAVKEVLESQIAILKENMNQQGMKVEAIEVTIASHEFERNLEENQQNPAKEQQEEPKPSRRGINLNNLDELEGLMSEEETLAAKIMQENGNSVDLTA